MAQVLVAGMGSPHGDDQVGWRAVEQLQTVRMGFRSVALREPTALLGQLRCCGRLVVVDACYSGSSPGIVHRLFWPIESSPVQLRSSHGFDLNTVLRLAEALGSLPSTVVLYAVEAERCQPGDDLSPAVRNALPSLIADLMRETVR